MYTPPIRTRIGQEREPITEQEFRAQRSTILDSASDEVMDLLLALLRTCPVGANGMWDRMVKSEDEVKSNLSHTHTLTHTLTRNSDPLAPPPPPEPNSVM